MSKYKKAHDTLQDAVKNPSDKSKLAAAKKDPVWKKTLTGFTIEDMKVLNKVAKAARVVKCT